MSRKQTSELGKTVLHDWHVANGARMVDFGGWDMPVQYPTGIIQEHLATRRRAGLFDVSHMGRFTVKGADAEAFLLRVLTNNARALEPGHAQYTFIANDRGGAVDDAYLYKLAAEDFLLVVNAGNRDVDWQCLERHLGGGGAAMTDVSERLAMIALQGPESSSILEQVVDKGAFPENKRNRLSTAGFNGAKMVIARTGYTGESVCFELFIESGRAVSLWESLVGLGAVPVGLGARDSLRMEAGLPLYGHELGQDQEDHEISHIRQRHRAVRGPRHRSARLRRQGGAGAAKARVHPDPQGRARPARRRTGPDPSGATDIGVRRKKAAAGRLQGHFRGPACRLCGVRDQHSLLAIPWRRDHRETVAGS